MKYGTGLTRSAPVASIEIAELVDDSAILSSISPISPLSALSPSFLHESQDSHLYALLGYERGDVASSYVHEVIFTPLSLPFAECEATGSYMAFYPLGSRYYEEQVEVYPRSLYDQLSIRFAR